MVPSAYCRLLRTEMLQKVQLLPEGCRQEERGQEGMRATVADCADSERGQRPVTLENPDLPTLSLTCTMQRRGKKKKFD